jgi:serine/threonine protein phosphatase PrpC
MYSIAGADVLHPGDVVHHAAFGFATVKEVDDRGAQLHWPSGTATSPAHVSRHALNTSWRRCRAGGVLARNVTDPEGVRRLAGDDPVALMGLLLADLGGEQGEDDLQEWLAPLVGRENLAAWWGAAMVLLSIDERFVLASGRLALAEGVRGEDFEPAEGVTEPLPVAPGPSPLEPTLRNVRGYRDLTVEQCWDAAERLAHGLAALHAAGKVLTRRHDAVRFDGTDWSLAHDSQPARPSVDVCWAARRFVEEMLGVELQPEIPSHDLVDLLPGTLRNLAPELRGVLKRALAQDPVLRPTDGLDLATQLAVARAVSRARAMLPTNPGAELVAGFDTHIGTLKALAGQTNQDSFLLLGDPDHAFVLVADGISTATAGSGDLASSLAARTLKLQWQAHHEGLRRADDLTAHRFLVGALERANRVVAEAAVRIAGGDLYNQIPMGTTAVAAVSVGDTLHLAAVGDSRAWVVGRHGVAPLLWDQNLSSQRLRQAASGVPVVWDERGHALVGYLGHFDETGEVSLPPVITVSIRLLPGEWLVLASDGVSDHAAPEEAGVYRMLELLVAEHGRGTDARTAMRLARRIALAANDGTGGDNVTVVTITLAGATAAE